MSLLNSKVWAAKLTPEERAEVARKVAKASWPKKQREEET
jgi:hypothetical protein